MAEKEKSKAFDAYPYGTFLCKFTYFSHFFEDKEQPTKRKWHSFQLQDEQRLENSNVWSLDMRYRDLMRLMDLFQVNLRNAPQAVYGNYWQLAKECFLYFRVVRHLPPEIIQQILACHGQESETMQLTSDLFSLITQEEKVEEIVNNAAHYSTEHAWYDPQSLQERQKHWEATRTIQAFTS
jgi:hypothetical protein